ncbi:MAG: HIT family protein [Candidatus Thorarchaeota archaeon]
MEKEHLENCPFCVPDKNRVAKTISYTNFPGREPVEIQGNIDLEANDDVVVKLASEQYSRGHLIVVLNKKCDDFADNALDEEDFRIIGTYIKKYSSLLKSKLGAKRVYVCSLCDGITHLHFHLIPRYESDPTGFGFPGDRERFFGNGYSIAPWDATERKEFLEKVASDLRREKSQESCTT